MMECQQLADLVTFQASLSSGLIPLLSDEELLRCWFDRPLNRPKSVKRHCIWRARWKLHRFTRSLGSWGKRQYRWNAS